MQLLYSFTEVNFPAKGLNTLLSPSTPSAKAKLQRNQGSAWHLLSTCCVHAAAEIVLPGHEEHHLLVPIYCYSHEGFVFEIWGVATLPRGAFRHLGHRRSSRTQWGWLQLVESCWIPPMNYNLWGLAGHLTQPDHSPENLPPCFQFWLQHRRATDERGTQTLPSDLMPYPNHSHLPMLGLGIISLHNNQDFMERRTFSGCETDEIEPAGWIHSSDHLDFMPAKYSLHGSWIISFPFVHRNMHEAGGSSSQKAFPSLPFLLLLLHESSKQGDCNFQRFLTAKCDAGAA